MTEQWKLVSPFGTTGTIYARDNERKIVNPGMRDFHYLLNVVNLVRAILKPKTSPVKTK